MPGIKFFFPVFDYIGAPLLFLLFILLFYLETKYALRKRKESRIRRIRRNVKLASVSLLFLRLLLIPGMVAIAVLCHSHSFGLFHWIDFPVWLEFLLGFLLLDYGNYGWHMLNHYIPFLWRFHNVHHIDLDLDVTTAIRFHVVEIILSVFSRGIVVLIIGASPMLVLIYEIFFEAATNFHHSNLRLPFKLEKNMSKVIVTPRMHGVHHSIVKREADSNFSVILSIWDRIHNTIRLNIPQHEINIGVPSYRNPSEQKFTKLLMLPFQKQKPWVLPNGKIPDRKGEKDYPPMKKSSMKK